MNNNTRKIVVLNKLHSPRIEQAIFILRDDVIAEETDAVSEARKIVDTYIKSLNPNQTEKSKKAGRKEEGRQKEAGLPEKAEEQARHRRSAVSCKRDPEAR